MKPLKGTKTHDNLKAAFAGESQANRRYLYFANKADVEGQNDVAALFRSTAEGETGHAHGHLDYLAQVGDPATDLPIGSSRQNGALVAIGVSLPDEPVRVAVDGQLAERMLQPLLDNATRYGHVVNVSVVRGNTVASIAIDDDGPGVAGDERDMIFEPGARGSASAGHDGAGLGLALAQRLARSAGGAIVAEPNEGGGRFTLKLPLAP